MAAGSRMSGNSLAATAELAHSAGIAAHVKTIWSTGPMALSQKGGLPCRAVQTRRKRDLHWRNATQRAYSASVIRPVPYFFRLRTFFLAVVTAVFFEDDCATFRFRPVADFFSFAVVLPADFFSLAVALPADLGTLLAIVLAFAPAMPPTTAPPAAPIGPTIDPAAAAAAAPPTIPMPGIESELFSVC